MSLRLIILFLFLFSSLHAATVKLGVDRIFEEKYLAHIKGKNIGLITNQTGLTSRMVSTIDYIKSGQKTHGYTLKALFAPEHGLYGEGYAEEHIASDETEDGIPIHSLHGQTRRPTKKMLEGLDAIIYDIQDIGNRSYTYASTLFYTMEEAVKNGVEVIVLDRPNPMGGTVVDGPMLEPEMRSFVGYINVPYCHGMTIGELAAFFNEEYKIGCKLTVVPMQGWKRGQRFSDTGLLWVPTSPNIPEASTVFYCPATGLLGQLSVVSIGIGYTLPFKVAAAPWIDEREFANELNRAKLPGVRFIPIRIKPFASSFAKKSCRGVLIAITDQEKFLPVTTQYMLFVTLKRLYPTEFKKGLSNLGGLKEIFLKICGTKAVYNALMKEKTTFQELRDIHAIERTAFKEKRKKHLFVEYK